MPSVSVISTSTVPVQPPTAITITSSTDGNGNSVQSGGSTLSTSITFHVTATQGTYPIAGFQCNLDDVGFSNCPTSSPGTITENNLAAGQQHTFTVRALDNQGNADLKPATFSWTVLTPQQATQNIETTIDNMNLPSSTATSLDAH